MFGNRWKLCVSRISGCALHFIYHYAVFFGVISFGVKRNDADCILVAYNRNWYKLFCVLTRLMWSSIYCYAYGVWATLNSYGWMTVMFGMRLLACLICTICILVLQIWYDKRIIGLVNDFIRLFRRVRAMSADVEKSGYGERHEMVLLGFKIISLAYIMCLIQFKTSPWAILTIVCDIYTSVGTAMIMHACFVAYLNIGVLYKELNHYVSNRLGSLQQPNATPTCLSQLKATRLRLEECLDIYDEIQSVCREFQRLFEVPLFLTLVQSLSTMAMIAYNVVIRHQFQNFNLWGLLIKMLLDVILLTLAVHSAVSNFRVIRRLSLETYFVNQSRIEHREMEMFLNRLHFNNLRVRPLGLFEVSNELTLFFLSAMITYLAILLQYGIQLKHF